MAREDGGRSDDVFSTGVLFRLPIADILSMIALKLEKPISWKCRLRRRSMEIQDVKRSFKSDASRRVNALKDVPRATQALGTNGGP